MLGQYFLQSWIDKSTPKPFNVTLTDLDVYIKVSIIQNGDDNMKVRFFKIIFICYCLKMAREMLKKPLSHIIKNVDEY